jgi:predicted nuclease of restriction endonuclease-like (RecB) superfamily
LNVDTLKKYIKEDLYHNQGSLPNNFMTNLPSSEFAKHAILAFKDEYMLDFINIEELGARDIEDVDERIVENKIVQNIKNFIMTFGRDFTFVGNQFRVEALGHTHIIDLLFFNRELSSLVAIELKTGPFKTAYLGQLNMYLRVLDDYVRKPNENQSIGIVLCKSADKAYVEYAVRDYDKPMGVATYKTATDMPERLRKALPDMEELKKLL